MDGLMAKDLSNNNIIIIKIIIIIIIISKLFFLSRTPNRQTKSNKQSMVINSQIMYNSRNKIFAQDFYVKHTCSSRRRQLIFIDEWILVDSVEPKLFRSDGGN